jgi:hypothetical protein
VPESRAEFGRILRPGAESRWSGTCGAWTRRPSSATTRRSCTDGRTTTKRSARNTPGKTSLRGLVRRDGLDRAAVRQRAALRPRGPARAPAVELVHPRGRATLAAPRCSAALPAVFDGPRPRRPSGRSNTTRGVPGPLA